MGFDLNGIDPQTIGEEPVRPDFDEASDDEISKYLSDMNMYHDMNPGVYFRANVWYWRPLWEYVCDICDNVLTEEDRQEGHMNNGYIIDKEKCVKISVILSLNLCSGATQGYSDKYQKNMNSAPDEECYLCDGTGERHDKWVDGECNGCRGKGQRRPDCTSYPFDIETVQEFAAFVNSCGGFEIF
tara:strand:+ start:138 stop:692 length:555 start_codon:yes stop_codon:yes gene_type:complete